MKKKVSITLEQKTLEKIDSVVDFIYIRNRSQAIEHLVNMALGENRTAIILSGGREEDSLIEKDVYRMTAFVKGRSIVERAVQVLRENGFKTIYIVARHKILTKVFEILRDGSSFGVKVNYIEEIESKGTADTLKLLKGKVNSPFLVVFGDLVFDKINIEELWKSHLKSNSIATLLLTTSPVPSEKGTVKMEGNKILEFVQKPKQSDIYLVFSPIFVAEPDILSYEGSSLEKDSFPELSKRGLLTGHLSSEKELHIHKKEDLRKIQ